MPRALTLCKQETPKQVYTLTNNEDPNEMLHYAISSSVSTLFVMVKKIFRQKRAITRLTPSHILYYRLKLGKHKKSCLSAQTSIWQPRNLISGMQNHVVDLYLVSSNYGPEAKNGPLVESQVLCKGFSLKQILSKPQVLEFSYLVCSIV